MFNYKMKISYDGSRYNGWQRLGDTDNTIQAKIEKVLSLLTEEEISLIGSGRTDAGVHALNQIANFKTTKQINPDQILSYCYKYLPLDILVHSVESVDDKFHARYNVKQKKYLYNIRNSSFHDVFNRKYELHEETPLDIDAMKKASSYLIGTMDYRSFTNMKSKTKNTVKTIYEISITKEGDLIRIILSGDGFLYNMVRIIVGTLMMAGKGMMKPDAIKNILEGRSRELAYETIAPHGLFLYDSIY